MIATIAMFVLLAATPAATPTATPTPTVPVTPMPRMTPKPGLSETYGGGPTPIHGLFPTPAAAAATPAGLGGYASKVKLQQHTFSNRPDAAGEAGKISAFPTVTPTVRSIVEYLKQITAYPEGDGLVVYLVLADKDGNEVADKGTAKVEIYDEQGNMGGIIKLAEPADFKATTLGLPAFRHNATVLSFGHISRKDLEVIGAGRHSLRVVVSFETTDGRVLKAAETTYVDWPD